jgi:uncharacterized protein
VFAGGVFMKVALASITQREKVFSLVNDGWFPAETARMGNIAATACLRRLDAASWSLAGHLRLTLSLLCDRCASLVPWPVDDKFVYRIVAEEDWPSDAEVDEESASLWPVSGPALDLAEVLRERVFLALPAKVLCAEDCRGLCPGCGADLNQELCRCSR